MTRQYIEPQTQLELNELNNGIASLIISHQNNLIIVGGKDGGVCFIDRDTFEIMKTHKFNSLGTYFKYSPVSRGASSAYYDLETIKVSQNPRYLSPIDIFR